MELWTDTRSDQDPQQQGVIVPEAPLMMPLVYVVVLNYNGEGWLRRCLESLLAGSYPCQRLLLVDNQSTDDSVALARSISSQIEILQNGANLGFCDGNNAAIRRALENGADYVALLNSDTYVKPEWLSRLAEVGESNSSIGILAPVQLVFDGDDFNSWTTTILPHALQSLRDRDEPHRWLPVEWVEGSCLVAKQKVFEAVGLLDPIFFAFFEELDFCRRARIAGFEVAIVPSSKIHHYRGGSFDQPGVRDLRDFLLLRNSMIYNSTDPALSFPSNLARLVHNDAVHLKDAVFGKGDLATWVRANFWVFLRLWSVYRKWRADRQAAVPKHHLPNRAGN